ncbi:capsular biosynthesis protein [Paraburkholderia sp. A1RI-2L]|uniref:capsular polysaccharide export protein, LipB/KpsS family n=1 Tax=Paraburkholderia sp. A1RI-2L TaxID=3028367 RepID=UPI003B7FB66D
MKPGLLRPRGTNERCASGPVWSRRANGGPPLSHSIVPNAARPGNALVRALSEQFDDPSTGLDADIPSLIRRVLRAGAGMHEQGLHLPREFACAQRVTRVVIVVPGGSAMNSRHRRVRMDAMLAAARGEYPYAQLWLWPEAGHRCTTASSSAPRAAPPGSNLLAALHGIACIYTVDSIEGLYGILAGVRVRVFGTPFYAGWGLTDDEHDFPGRIARPDVNALFDAFYLRLARYIDPVTRSTGTLAAVLDAIDAQRAVQQRFADLERLSALRFQFWKRRFAAPFIAAGGGIVRWSNEPHDLRRNEHAVLWGAREIAGLPAGARVVRMEDGFLHSWGLGSDMIAPRSQVIDREGIYFDPRRPSELTRILNDTSFDEAELARAATLRRSIAKARLTKYNLGVRTPVWRAPAGRRILLVVGQVADDASVRYGTGRFATIDALLAEVRARHPDSFLVYKPHPDVLSGNRQGVTDAGAIADVVDAASDLISLIEAVDEVHTLSSLAGFDALLRSKQVFTYGLPFYAGWGLTHDALAPLPNRARALTLDMLVAGALIRYPLYWDWKMRMFTSPEAVVAELKSRANRPFDLGAATPARMIRKSYRWSRNVLLHALTQVKRPMHPFAYPLDSEDLK